MSHSTYRKIFSNLTVAEPPAGYPCLTRIARERCIFFRNIFPPLRHRRSRRNTYSCGGESSSSSSGNKVCFIFTIPPAKYRPVFPRDIDISGVPGLLLLTPFLHWHGIYVFFLLSPPSSPLPALPLSCSVLSSPLCLFYLSIALFYLPHSSSRSLFGGAPFSPPTHHLILVLPLSPILRQLITHAYLRVRKINRKSLLESKLS